MNPGTYPNNPGEEFGRKAMQEVMAKAEAYCSYETQRIALETQSRVAALRAELARLQDEEHVMQQRLHRALPALDGGGLFLFSFSFLFSPLRRTASVGKVTSTARASRLSPRFALRNS